ncbi:DUF3419 family protein [Maricaulis sp.]|uniref:DUF3419 family protein n=1 Tax=Maricaulis sp. TaxID=1486257 RepID=UPI001B219C05|nr:DUF3419 family protein [Maricaulis sp.]MBO6798502.1 DUF3419 family protein [Maricaulis sp.]
MSFATSLNFTSSNEDGRTELAALDLSPEDRVLCLTASGTRPLDLLLGDPGDILAIDINPAQNHLLRLKIAAFKTLADDELYAYLGLQQTPDRLALHARVETVLSEDARRFWSTRTGLVRKGVWNTGRWERVLRFLARILRLVRGRRLDQLFAARTVEEQHQIWLEHFEDAFWKSSIHLLSSRFFWTHVIGEPGGQFLPDRTETTRRLTAAFHNASKQFLFGQSDFATLIFLGQHTSSSALPLHLQRANLARVRDRLDRIEIADTDLAALEPDQHGSFTAFSLSDFGSYCTPQAYAACWDGVLKTARPGARFCERVFMNPLALPASLEPRISLDKTLSDQFSNSDGAIIYDIRAGRLEIS